MTERCRKIWQSREPGKRPKERIPPDQARGMKTEPATDNSFESEEDALRCAHCMSPEIEAYLEHAAANYKGNLDAASWALTWGFADLLRQFHGDMTMLERTVATFTEMTADSRTAARECKERVQGILLAMTLKGFSTTALAWAMLGVLSNITTQIIHARIPNAKRAQREADKFTENLIMALNRARQTVLN
jgi:hypothetical protein